MEHIMSKQPSKYMKRKRLHHYAFVRDTRAIPMSVSNGATEEYTCLNCGHNVRFDPRYNELYGYPLHAPKGGQFCA